MAGDPSHGRDPSPGSGIPTHALDEAMLAGPAGFPERIGRYARDRQLGRGGMGEVWRYHDPHLGRFVAAKAVPTDVAAHPDRGRRLEREARLLATVDHPHVAGIYDLVRTEKAIYLLMECVEGRTLAEVLREGPLPLSRALAVARQLGAAIAAGHALRVVHRDVKPGNVMVTARGDVKLLDFGLARDDGDAPPRGDADGATWSATTEGRVMGTPGYMSPEQACGAAVDEAADVWAFGCVLYECLVGAPAFPGRSAPARIAATIRARPDLDRLPPATPAAVRRALATCFATAPEDRPEIEALLPVFDPAAAPAGVGADLPATLNRYVPRPGELARLLALVGERRLVTLTGTGGAGKTRLALELARRAAEESPLCADGVRLADLQPLGDADLLAERIESAVQATTTREHERLACVDRLTRTIGERRLLLVLDNCEHLLDACATIVVTLLRDCPQLRIVATSRAALGVAGESTYRVPRLAVPTESELDDAAVAPDRWPALTLFTERARLVRPEFALDAESAAFVARICRRLDGTPLAIELAAARLASMGLRDLADHLFEVLDPGDILGSSIRWSIALLDAPERRLLARLAVFRGGWSAADAEVVAGDRGGPRIGGRPVRSVLGQLVAHSLVVFEESEGRARYRLLETVQAHLDSAGPRGRARRAVADRHLAHALALAESAADLLSGPEGAGWIARLELDHDNLRAALSHALGDDSRPGTDQVRGRRLAHALHRFWYLRGRYPEGRTWLERAVAGADATSDRLVLRSVNAIGVLASAQGDVPAARQAWERALEAARQAGDELAIAGLLTNLGLTDQSDGAVARAEARHREARDLYAAAEHADGVAWADLNLAVAAKWSSRWDEAESLLLGALERFRATGDRSRAAAAQLNLGEVHLGRGDAESAIRLLREGLRLATESGDRHTSAKILTWLGIAEERLGHAGRAARILASARSLQRSMGLRLDPADRTQFEKAVASARRDLDDASFSGAWEAGSVEPLEPATAYALAGEPEDPLAGDPSGIAPAPSPRLEPKDPDSRSGRGARP